MIPLLFSKSVYAKRRQELAETLTPDQDILVYFQAPEQVRNHDCDYRHRSDSAFLYLTGYAEPESAFLMWREKGKGKKVVTRFHFFVLPRDPAREQWTGLRYGKTRAKTLVGADACDTIDNLAAVLLSVLQKVPSAGKHPRLVTNAQNYLPRKIFLDRVLETFRPNLRQGKFPIAAIENVSSRVGQLRLVKDSDELKVLRKAAKINVAGHLKVMETLRPGQKEYEVQALVEYEFRRRGCWDPSYNSICAAGANATILHYNENSDTCREGDLFLIDAGCEYMGYASDITRTLPIGGTYNPAQRKIMDIVAEAHAAGVQACRVGNAYTEIHRVAELALIEGLRHLKLLKGSVKEILASQTHRRYFPHGTGHWMGIDVHDPCPTVDAKGHSMKLQSGMVTTVEPGLYFMENDETVSAEFRGIGVRIEDDVVVTKGKPEILTEGLPRYAGEIEKHLKKIWG